MWQLSFRLFVTYELIKKYMLLNSITLSFRKIHMKYAFYEFYLIYALFYVKTLLVMKAAKITHVYLNVSHTIIAS